MEDFNNEQNNIPQNYYNYNNNVVVECPEASTILTLGIVAVATCGIGIPAIIVGAIGRSKAKECERVYGLTGKAKVGSIMSLVGFIVGICMTVFWIIYFIAIIALIDAFML